MKRILLVILAITMLAGLFGCGNSNNGGNGGGNEPTEPGITGKTKDIGRLSVLIPDGWSYVDLGDMSDGYTAIIVHGKEEDFGQAPQVSVIYCLPSEIVVSSAAFYDNVIQKPAFDLGGLHWTSWTGSYMNLKSEVAETEGDFGYITVNRLQTVEGGEMPSLSDPEVKAIMESIVVRPTITVDWVKIDGGKAVCEFPAYEGRVWDPIASSYSSDVEGDYEVEGNTATVNVEKGTGMFGVQLRLINEECTEEWGRGNLAFKVENGKITGIYDASVTIYDQPQDIEWNGWEDDTDYEAIEEFLAGAWADNANGLTMFLQKYEEIEHAFIITIQGLDRTFVATGVIQEGGSMWYEEVSVNGADPVASDGWFMIDGDSLIWGHDEAVGEFENATFFTKID